MNITKSFEFCYGHRVWNQTLSSGVCRCRAAHGHTGKIDVTLSGEVKNGMVLDFNELKIVKNQIDTFIDHKFLMDVEDPLLVSWLDAYHLDGNVLTNGKLGFFIDCHTLNDEVDKEFFSSLVILPFVPTSENLALWTMGWVKEELRRFEGVKVFSVRWWESDKSFAEASV